jgi:Radical SAM superfamily
MNNIQSTVSLCEYCYRHIPANLFERDGSIWISKECPEHGYDVYLVEPDAEFYLNFRYTKHPLITYCLDITNRCNLNCPHCYQMPDNSSKDLPIDYFVKMVESYEDDGYNIALMGAEPTTRKDLPELINSIRNIPGKLRKFIVLTNGVNLSNINYARQFLNIKELYWTIGLNHSSYQGSSIRSKQLQGIQNCKELNFPIKCISYTLESLDQMEFCLNEIQMFGKDTCQTYRIRCGAKIGRCPDETQLFMSTLVKEAKRICDKNKWTFESDDIYSNRAHYSSRINGLHVKIIQWPDVTTINLEEMQTEAWADMIPGQPVSPLVHQAILRDGAINKGLPLFDSIPVKYRRYD